MTGFLIFASFFTLAACAGHYYLYRRLLSLLNFSGTQKRFFRLALSFAALAGPTALYHFYFTGRGAVFVVVFFTWLGLSYLLGFGFFLVQVFEAVANKKEIPKNMERRKLLLRTLNFTAVSGALGVSAYGVTEALHSPRIKEVHVRLKNWPTGLNGFTIAQITDLHIGPTIQSVYVQAVVDLTNSIGADLIALTGDLVDGSVERLSVHSQLLKGLEAQHGVYFVTGNHEYYSGVTDWLNEFQSYGFRVLRNESVLIRKGDDSFNLAGIDDQQAKKRHPDHGPDLMAALSTTDPTRPTILLAHQPKGFDLAIENKVALQISGHTHGGQVFPFGLVVALVQPFVRGLHYVEDSCIYVSCGTGFWGPALRVAAPSEITKIVISSTSEN